MSRISDVFSRARSENRAAFIAYITAGDPSISRTAELVGALAAAGADIVELGIPFSDPIADGPTNQAAAERALAAGTRLEDIFESIREIRENSQIPIVLFSYANPVLRRGVSTFADEASRAGADALLFTDVPVEEMARFSPALENAGIDPIMLVTPTSNRSRIRAASRMGSGFLYLVSRLGVTGAQNDLDDGLEELVGRVRKSSKLPLAVGFGISTPEQVSQVAKWSDGVVVGSAIVNMIDERAGDEDLPTALENFVRPLVEACQRQSSS